MRITAPPLTEEHRATIARLGSALRGLRTSQVITGAYADGAIQRLRASKDPVDQDRASYMVGQIVATAAIARSAA